MLSYMTFYKDDDENFYIKTNRQNQDNSGRHPSGTDNSINYDGRIKQLKMPVETHDKKERNNNKP
jgi:hypothetical protein